MGMSVDDFDRLLPEEFGAVLRQWRREQNRREASWLAGVRLHAAITIQPHCRKKIRPADLFDIPDVDTPEDAPRLTREQKRARFEYLKKIRGYE